MNPLETPVVLIIFNRPKTTEKVLNSIRKVRPRKLFLIADGPRKNHFGDAKLCAKAREIAEQQIDWDCTISKNYSNYNLGCAKRVSSGLDWVFKSVDKAIILEDDCVPDMTFYPFCEVLLDKYEFDERIMSISGQNVQFGKNKTEYSYYFSAFHHCWGWATWKRAWKHFDFEMSLWEIQKAEAQLSHVLQHKKYISTWAKRLEATKKANINSWANRWMYACWMQSGLSVVASRNLVSNIGFNDNSTNTKASNSRYSYMDAETIDFPLTHPPYVFRYIKADQYTQNTLYRPLSWPMRIKYKTKSFFEKL